MFVDVGVDTVLAGVDVLARALSNDTWLVCK